MNQKLLFYILSATLFATALATDLPTTVPGKVKANVLNVRVNPGTAYTVVAKLKAGDEVAVLRRQGDWYEIIAPRDASVWVAAEYLRDGKTTAELNLRSGPSVNHRPYGVVPVGTPLVALGEKQGDWIKIAPPPSVTAWVGSEFVECDESAFTSRIPQQEPTTEAVATDSEPSETTEWQPRPLSPDTERAGIDAPVGDNEIAPDEIGHAPPPLPFVEGTEKMVVVKGVVYPLKAGAVYVTHALVEHVDDGVKVLCYLHGGGNTLKVWEQRSITVTGRQKLVHGWNVPVVEAERISTDW